MSKSKTPVILIPGFTGSRLKTCFQNSKDYPLWLDRNAMRTPSSVAIRDGSIRPTQWWIEQMSLAEDGMTPRCTPECNGPVQGLEAISILDPSPGHAEASRYFGNLIQILQRNGYTHENLRAVPYDWRMPPAGLQQREHYFTKLKSTIEELVNLTSTGTPATIIGHSLGNRVTQYFLEFVLATEKSGQAWIDQYIGRYIAVSALWLGVPKSIREALTGADGLGLIRIDGLKPVYQSYGALPWMLPVTDQQYVYLNTESFAFVGKHHCKLTINSALEQGAKSTRRYMQEFFLNDPCFTQPGQGLGSLAVCPPPVAQLNVLYATGQDTEIGAYYIANDDGLSLNKAATDNDPQFHTVNGIRYETATQTKQKIDGTTNSGDSFLPYGSLCYFTSWQQQYPDLNISGQSFPGRTHYNILQDEAFLMTVMELLR